MQLLAVAGALVARISRKKRRRKSFEPRGRGSVARGKEVFEKEMRDVPFADKRREEDRARSQRTFQARNVHGHGNKVQAEALTTWIENGDSLMPGMKDSLEASTDRKTSSLT